MWNNSKTRPTNKARFGPGFLFFLILALAAAIFLTGIVTYGPSLVARDAKTGQKLVLGPMAEGDSFELCFIHSVDILPVRDQFVNKNGELYLTRTKCFSFGAGLGYAGQGVLSEEGRWTVISDMNRKVGTLPLRIGTIADHTIVFKGKAYRLADYFKPKTLVDIGVERRWILWGDFR